MLHTLTCNPFGEQTYVLEHGDGSATVFDPGMSNRTEQATFLALVEKLGVVITQCLLTHAHLDHVMGCGWVQERWGLAPRIHPTKGPRSPPNSTPSPWIHCHHQSRIWRMG